MAENIVVNGVTYNGVDSVEFETPEGECVAFFPPRDGFLPSVITPGDTPVVIATPVLGMTGGTSLRTLGVKMTIPKTGTYRIKFWGCLTSWAGTSMGVWMYKNGAQLSATKLNGTSPQEYSADMSLVAGDVLELWGRGATQMQSNTGLEYISVTMYAVGGGLMACANV